MIKTFLYLVFSVIASYQDAPTVALTTLPKMFAEDCKSGITTGNGNFKKDKDNIDDTSGVMFLVTSSMYNYTCCGLVKQFKSYAMADGDLYYIIWRPTGEEGKYKATTTIKSTLTGSPKSSSILPSGNSQPQIADGDLIGWYSPGQSSIPYIENANIDGAAYMMTRTGPVPENGEIIDWSSATEQSQRMYALSTVVIDGVTPPEFKVSEDAVEIRSSAAIGAVAYRLGVTSRPSQDTRVTLESTSQFFHLNEDDNIAVKSLLDIGTYELIVSARDVCGYSASATITITVTQSTGKSSNPTTPSKNAATTDPQPQVTDAAAGIQPQTDPNPSPGGSAVTIELPIFDLTLTPIEDLNSTYTNNTEFTGDEDDDWKYALGFGVTLSMCMAITLCGYYLFIWKKKRQTTKPKQDPEKLTETNLDEDAKDGDTEKAKCKGSSVEP